MLLTEVNVSAAPFHWTKVLNPVETIIVTGFCTSATVYISSETELRLFVNQKLKVPQ